MLKNRQQKFSPQSKIEIATSLGRLPYSEFRVLLAVKVFLVLDKTCSSRWICAVVK